MKKNKFRYAKKKIHKRMAHIIDKDNQIIESPTHTSCSIRLSGKPLMSFDWRDVTCGNCLRTKKRP
jgi:hypothetical protein